MLTFPEALGVSESKGREGSLMNGVKGRGLTEHSRN